jgi:hypothetical protein
MRSAFFTDYNFRNEFALWLKHLGLARLEHEFRSIQSRLGTAAELPKDLDRAQAIGHQLRSLLSHPPTFGGGIHPVSGGELHPSRRVRTRTGQRQNSKLL